MPCVVYEEYSKPSGFIHRVERILRSPDMTKISTASAKELVAKNRVFVFKVSVDTGSPTYWNDDGFSWKMTRTQKKPDGKEPKFLKKIFRLRSGKILEDFYRHEYWFLGEDLSPPNAWKRPYVLVRYVGNFNLKNFKRGHHGNRKATPQKASVKKFFEMLGFGTPVKKSVPESGNTTTAPAKVVHRTPVKQIARKSTCHRDAAPQVSKAKRTVCTAYQPKNNDSSISPGFPSFVPTNESVRQQVMDT